ncbi:MotA/TolQ/ExbB proton channel family protein [Bacteriovoracaceae bacterium]|nr:MotA/TolQ/ExbB proton channel family protein [Bacteriovoracaceae bacterium]
MNILSVLGFILAIGVLGFGLNLAAAELGLKLFYDIPSIFIVIGGSFASTAISFQLNRIVVLFKIFVRRVIFGKKHNYVKVINEIVSINESYRKGDAIENLSGRASDFFLKEALDLAKGGVLQEEEILRILDERNDNMFASHLNEANKMKVVAKYPPAFGMIGTTMGMIVLLANLDKPDAMKFIGPAMGVCLITTLYGAVLANALFIPIAENLSDDSKETYLKNQIVIKGVELVMQKTNPILLIEELNSFLAPGERLNWSKGA